MGIISLITRGMGLALGWAGMWSQECQRRRYIETIRCTVEMCLN